MREVSTMRHALVTSALLACLSLCAAQVCDPGDATCDATEQPATEVTYIERGTGRKGGRERGKCAEGPE